MDDGWEVTGITNHRSLAAAGAVAIWLMAQPKLAGWEFAATTLGDGSHRVMRRRRPGSGAEPRGGADRPNARPRTAHAP